VVGAIPVGYVVARILGVDIRRRGSGNIGATNVLRTAGWTPALATLFGDIGKGYIATWIGSLAGAEPAWAGAAAVLAVVGNCWPDFLRFRGGKGVATGAGAFLFLQPLATVGGLLAFAVTAGLTRYVSLGSCSGAVVLAALAFVLGGSTPIAWCAVGTAILVVWKHRANLGRIAAGTESRLGASRS